MSRVAQDPWATGSQVARRQLDRIALLALGIFWSTFVGLYILRAALVNPPEIIAGMLPRLAIASVGAVLSWTMYRILELLPPRPVAWRIVRTVALSVPMAMLFAASDAVLGGVVLVDLTVRCPGNENCTWSDVWSLEVTNTISWLFVFAAWGLLHLAIRATIEARAADSRATAEREAARIAEIRALRYQVNPHFLFNCLNSLGTLVDRSDRVAARRMIGQLSSFLRYGLAIDPLADVDLEDEVEMQSRYLEIERLRFGHRLTVIIDIKLPLQRARIPSLLLQPLVENAIKHGVATTSGPVTVALRASIASNGQVRIIVDDDAPKAEGDQQPELGIGLRNVRERLRARFEETASLVVGTLPDGGFRAEILMPLVRL